MKDKLLVRELQLNDIPDLAAYWLDSPDDYLLSMGVDLNKLPDRNNLQMGFEHQLSLPIKDRRSYALIWELNGRAIGHNNVDQIVFGKEAYMHLHIWQAKHRQLGFGMQYLKMSIPIFFQKLELSNLYSEPYSKNPGPNRCLQKLGFQWLKNYRTKPGSITREQEVSRWQLSRKQGLNLIH